jgi:hypothetical protein
VWRGAEKRIESEGERIKELAEGGVLSQDMVY